MQRKRLRKTLLIKTVEMKGICDRVSKELTDTVRTQLFEICKIPDDQAELKEKLMKESYRILRIQYAYQEYMRIISGEFRLDRKYVDIAAELNSICALVRKEADAKGIPFVLKLSEKDIYTMCDIERFRFTFMSLVTNSIIFSAKGNKIVIKMVSNGKNVKVTVSDKGMGMSKEVLERCEDPFFSTDNGTGLGLTIIKYYISEIGGRIKIDSKENVGTTVTFCFPIVAESEDNFETANSSRDDFPDREFADAHIVFSILE